MSQSPASVSSDSFSARFWYEQSTHPGSLISPTFTHYRDSGYSDPTGSPFSSSCLGFAGAPWLYLTLTPNFPFLRAKFTNNLWHQGEIPVAHRGLFAHVPFTRFLAPTANLCYHDAPSSTNYSPNGTAARPFILSREFSKLDYTSDPCLRLPPDPTLPEVTHFLDNLCRELLGQVPSDSTVPFAHKATPFIWSDPLEWSRYPTLPRFYLGLMLDPTPTLRSILPNSSDPLFIAIPGPLSIRYLFTPR